MGSGRSDIWIHFDAIKVDGVAGARCKKCNHEMVNNAERMKSHFNACPKKTGDCTLSSLPQIFLIIVSLATILIQMSIKDLDEQIVPEVMKFMSKALPYNAAYFEGIFKDADPVSWWKFGVKMGFDQNLAKVQFRWCLPLPLQEAWKAVPRSWKPLTESCGHRWASRRPVNWRLWTANGTKSDGIAL